MLVEDDGEILETCKQYFDETLNDIYTIEENRNRSFQSWKSANFWLNKKYN